MVSALDSPAGKQRHCIRLHSHSPDGVIRLQTAGGAHEGAAGTDAGHEVRHIRKLAQDLNAGSKVVGLWVILIFKLLGLEAANLLRQISGPLKGCVEAAGFP